MKSNLALYCNVDKTMFYKKMDRNGIYVNKNIYLLLFMNEITF